MSGFLRLEAQSRIKKRRFLKADDAFPLSPRIRRYVNHKSLSYPDAACLESPPEVVRTLLFGRDREDITGSDGSLRSLVSNPLLAATENPDDNNDAAVRQQRVEWMKLHAERQTGSARKYQSEQPWRCISLADMDYEIGWNKVVPNGCEQFSPAGPKWLDRPISESAVFDNQNSDEEDLYRPREQGAAAELLSVPEMNVFHWGGCGQRKLADKDSPHFCCSAVPRHKYETNMIHGFQDRHKKALLNQQIECEANRHVVTYLHNLNVNRLAPIKETDNAPYYIHAFAFDPSIQRERIDVIDEVINHQSYLRPDIPMGEIAHSYVSEWEAGFLSVDSALQISLDRDQQRRMLETSQSFKEECPAFLQHESRLVKDNEVFGPAYPSPSQLYEMGAFRRYQIHHGRWEEEPVPAAPKMALPRSHQAFRNWTDPRLDKRYRRIHDDGEMAMPSFVTIQKDLKGENRLFPPFFESNQEQRLRQEESEIR